MIMIIIMMMMIMIMIMMFQEFELLVVAETPSGAKVSSRINVVVTDSNDNVPEFAEPGFEFSVGEDADPGTPVGTIQAADPDTGQFIRQLC